MASIKNSPAEPTDGRWIVTPEIARAWLARFNIKNRHPRPEQIAALSRTIRNKEWIYNAEPITFSPSRLIQGQHRLMACAATGIAIDTDVRTGVADAAYATIDGGCRRSNADHLSVEGEKNSFALAAAVGWLWRWERGGSFANPGTPTPIEVADLLKRHPQIRASIVATRTTALRKLSGTVAAFVHYRANQIDAEACERFFRGLSDGIGIESKTDPIWLLKNRLECNREAKAKLLQHEILALYIKAWNCHRRGRTMKSLRWRTTGDAPETFPGFDDGAVR